MEAGKKSDGIISRTINRRFSRVISRFIIEHNIDITPNQITILLLLSSIPVPLLYYMGHPIFAGIMIQILSMLDGVDGEIARYKKMATKMGALLDSIFDRISNILFIIGASYYAMIHENIFSSETILIISITALSGDLLVSYFHSKVPEIIGIHPALIGKTPSFASRDVRLFILFLLSLTKTPSIGLIAISFISYSYLTAKFFETIKHLKPKH